MNNELVDKGWEQMELLLNENLPIQRKRKFALYFWILGAVMLAALLYTLLPSSAEKIADLSLKSPSPLVQQNEVIKHATALHDEEIASTSTKTTQQENFNKELTNNISTVAANSSHIKSTSTFKHSSATQQQVNGQFSKRIPGKLETSENQIDGMQDLNQSPTIESGFNNAEYQQEQRSESLNKRKNSNSSTRLIQSVPTLDKLPLNLFIATAEESITYHQIEPISKPKPKTYRFQAYLEGSISDHFYGGALGINLHHRLSQRLAFATGIELTKHMYDMSHGSDAIVSPNEEVFASSLNYSGYLSDYAIAPDKFISSITTLYIPLQFRYDVFPKLAVIAGLKPGVQIKQSLSYNVLNSSTDARNPDVGREGHSAQDFFNLNSIAVVDASLGFDYCFTKQISVGMFYHTNLSNSIRGVNYANIDQLESRLVGQVDRRFYSIPSKEIRSHSMALRLAYRF